MADYRIMGARYLRRYSETGRSPVTAAAMEAQRIVNTLCDLPWERVAEMHATVTSHGNDDASLNGNVDNRDRFDAALFCAEHANGMHRAFANAAVYVYEMPDSAVGTSAETVRCQVNTDYYNSQGVRLHVWTGPDLEIPMSCRTVRGETPAGVIVDDGTTAAGVAKRTSRIVDGTEMWYTTSETVALAPTGGLTLQKYLFILVALESYSTVRGNWLEGSSYIDNDVILTLDSTCADLDATRINDLSPALPETEFPVVSRGVVQSNFTALSGLYGLEVLGNGDGWADIPQKDVATAVEREAMALSDGAAASLAQGGYSPDEVRWTSNMAHAGPVVTSSSNVLYCQYLLMYASGQFRAGSDNASNGVSRKVIKLINTASGAERDIDIPLMTDEDAAAGVALAYVEGWDSEVNVVTLHVYCGNGAHYATRLYYYSEDGQSWHSFLQPVPADYCTREVVADIPVAAMLNRPVYKRGGSIVFSYKDYRYDDPPETSVVVAVDGTITHVHGCDVPETVMTAGFLTGDMTISGDLSSVTAFDQTVRCRNCAIVHVNVFAGAQRLTVPEWDAAITPDTYENFKVTPVMPLLTSDRGAVSNPGGYIVTGSFTKLGGVDAPGCAMVSSDGTVTPLRLSTSNGEADAVLNVMALASGRTYYQAAKKDHAISYSHPDLLRCQEAVQVPAGSGIGLRSLYAKFYLGRFRPVSVDDQNKRRRQGAGFTTGRVTRSGVAWYDDSGATGAMAVACLRMSASSMLIPFSIPITFAVQKVRLSWTPPAGWSVNGGMLNVWIYRDAYVETLPDEALRAPDIYIAGSPNVGGWELVGRISADDAQTAGSVDFTLATPLKGRVASLLVTGFVGQDDIAYLADGERRGVGALDVDAETGSADGTSNLFRPDITLVGFTA